VAIALRLASQAAVLEKSVVASEITSRMPELTCTQVSRKKLLVGMWQLPQLGRTPAELLTCADC
jgi:hypothetical protein